MRIIINLIFKYRSNFFRFFLSYLSIKHSLIANYQKGLSLLKTNHCVKKLSLLLIFCFSVFYAQEYTLPRNFNTENSELSGDFIFDMLEDDQSLLWIATDNGISRFDGKHFYNYTTKNGLPSNEVIQLIRDRYGTIWANTLRQPPSYFDEKQNRFVTLNTNNIEKKSTTFLKYGTDYNGNINFTSADGKPFSINESKKITTSDTHQIKIESRFINVEFSSKKDIEGLEMVHNKIILYTGKIKNTVSFFNNSIYLFTEGKEIFKYDNFQLNPFNYRTEKLKFSKPLEWIRIMPTEIRLITADHHFQRYDSRDLKLIQNIPVDKETNFGFVTSGGIFITGSTNNGFRLYSQTKIRSIEIPDKMFKGDFISLGVNDKSEVYSGNIFGEIMKYDGKTVHKIKIDSDSWIRKILFFKNKPVLISDKGYGTDFRKWLKVGISSGLKKGIKINDSIFLLSGIGGLYKLNVQTRQSEKLNFPEERTGEILNIDNTNFDIISSSGLYRYNLADNTAKKIYEKYNFDTAATDGTLLFISTFAGEIYIFREGKLLEKISSGNSNIPLSITKMKLINGRLWIAGKDGLSILSYHQNGKMHYSLFKISKKDGLHSDKIADIFHHGKYVYAAAGNHINIIPEGILSEKFKILVHLIALEVNNIPQNNISRNYSLGSGHNSVKLTFSAAELSGKFGKFQYRINDNEWTDFYSPELNLNLKEGKNKIEIRALDNNNNPGKTLLLNFDVKIPFYKSILFWMIASGLFVGGIIFLYSRWKFMKQKNEFDSRMALENQRKKITADLHDDIGATLSSLQINSSIANRLIEKNELTKAQNVLSSIEKQSKKLSENIGDIIWSLKPGEESLMTLSTRIKNTANDILGNTNINYHLKIDERVDEYVVNFSIRKNIVLIVKEVLNNAAKYSEAKNLFLTLEFHEGRVDLEISDDGIGFANDEVKGNGLSNMKKRAAELNGSCEIISGNGVLLKFSIPNIRD